MKWESKFFSTPDEAFAVANKLVDDDRFAATDRQRVANFYNGRDTMTNSEAESQNVGNVVNHLFGYNNIEKLRSQINGIFTSGDVIWKVSVTNEQAFDARERDLYGALCTEALARRLRRSRRLKPEARVLSGNLVLHGRDTMCMPDNFDWCPKSSFLYVPRDCPPHRDGLPYAFRPENISYDKLVAYEKKAKAAGADSGWNTRALSDAVKTLRPDSPNAPLGDAMNPTGVTAEAENNQGQLPMDGTITTRSTLPVWYLYEIDHSKVDKPISLKILARYTLTADRTTSQSGTPEKETIKDALLYSNPNEFKSVRQWNFPFFIDTEIGGKPLWTAAVGIGRLNYPRDADVEEFFNLAMDGAKDAMRMKWKVADGASRQKIERFFAERSDLLPEGMEPVKMEVAGNWQHAIGVIDILRRLSSEDAGTGISNTGTESDELEIQAAERQAGAQALVASRMADIYDSMDDLGTEILRRFLVAPLNEDNPGYCDIHLFREELKRAGISDVVREKLGQSEHGEFLHLEVKTVRAFGDGSRVNELQSASQLMGSLGAFNPAGQEIIKRDFVKTVTRDPDKAAAIVPYQDTVDPDQISRARNENSAALSRGIVGFTPSLNPDDVNMIHIPEHDSELEALVKKSEAAGGMNEYDFAGFKSLATHQGAHIRNMQGGGDKRRAEEANAWSQKLERLATAAQGLQQAFEANKQNSEIDPAERIKLQQKERQLDQADRSQASIEQDREARRELDSQLQATNEAKMITDAASKAAMVTAPQAPAPTQ